MLGKVARRLLKNPRTTAGVLDWLTGIAIEEKDYEALGQIAKHPNTGKEALEKISKIRI